MNEKRMNVVSTQIVEDLKVKTPGIKQKLKFLSGGNQQKVIIGKWLTRDCDILIFDEPTAGLISERKVRFISFLRTWRLQANQSL